MNVVVFLGPTMPVEEAATLLDAYLDRSMR